MVLVKNMHSMRLFLQLHSGQVGGLSTITTTTTTVYSFTHYARTSTVPCPQREPLNELV